MLIRSLSSTRKDIPCCVLPGRRARPRSLFHAFANEWTSLSALPYDGHPHRPTAAALTSPALQSSSGPTAAPQTALPSSGKPRAANHFSGTGRPSHAPQTALEPDAPLALSRGRAPPQCRARAPCSAAAQCCRAMRRLCRRAGTCDGRQHHGARARDRGQATARIHPVHAGVVRRRTWREITTSRTSYCSGSPCSCRSGASSATPTPRA